jgi:alpha-glucosidase (family GH31 glycosyl hydrolase)
MFRDKWQQSMAIVDFTNPEAYKWYSGLIEELLLTGVDTIKTDFGERIPHIDVQWHDGSDPWKMHKWVWPFVPALISQLLHHAV